MKNGNNFRYLPVLAIQRQWGLYLADCGYTVIKQGTPYPPGGHPAAYDFTFDQGRVLTDYHVIYITHGRGIFEAKGCSRKSIEAGDVMVLFPGIWHRYKPDPATGWEEHWVGFNGSVAKQIMRPPFFSHKKPVRRIGVHEYLRQRFVSLVNDIDRNPAGAPFSSAAHIHEILGLIQERSPSIRARTQGSNFVREAQNQILLNATALIDFAALQAKS
ncbi:MAG: AraC family ligand binding domain-containing protein [Kiritimatiellae bacterium]|nr:AraC family ligand binding domain-containing protein [Kiritimatiellia bacterium]